MHLLTIGGRADLPRLVFDAKTGPAVNASVVEMGNRLRMIVNPVDVVPIEQPLPKLPVARALWKPKPDLKTAAAAWIYAGGAHHTGFSFDVTAEHLADVAGELEQIDAVRTQHAQRIAIVPWMVEEPVGPARLLALARAGSAAERPSQRPAEP